MVQPLGKTVSQLLKMLNIEIPCDPAILLLGIYPKEVKAGTQTDTCTPRFTVVGIHNGEKVEKIRMPINN